jgi:hypothetical protein
VAAGRESAGTRDGQAADVRGELIVERSHGRVKRVPNQMEDNNCLLLARTYVEYLDAEGEQLREGQP